MGLEIELVCLDLDGVIYRGDVLIDGARFFIQKLIERGVEYLFVTNSTLFSREFYARKLRKLGIPATKDRVITAAYATYKYVEMREGTSAFSAFLLAERGLRRELSRLNCRFLKPTSSERADYVIVALDRRITYGKLCKATWDIMDGAVFIGVNNDALWPVENGFMPGVGVFVSALETATGRKAYIVGKPNTFMLELAREKVKVPPSRILMVGDKLDSDILMGNRAGVHTALVLTGVTSLSEVEQAEGELKPEIVAEDLVELWSKVFG